MSDTNAASHRYDVKPEFDDKIDILPSQVDESFEQSPLCPSKKIKSMNFVKS